MAEPFKFTLSDGFDLAGIGIDDIWLRYLANGGSSQPDELADRIAGVLPCENYEHDLIAQTLNEYFIDQGLTSFPVGYRPRPARCVSPDGISTGRRAPLRMSGEAARSRASDARRRGADAAREAALLHLSAAKLMQRSGQLLYARRARARAEAALRRVQICVTS